MKKILTVLIILLLSVSCVFAAFELKKQYSNGIDINGFVKSYCIANFYPITDSTNDGVGMPFDIMGSDINYQADHRFGREIARWTIATNLVPVITINATPLVSVDNPAVSIDYILSFRLAYDGDDGNGNSITTIEYFDVYSNSTNVIKSTFTGLVTPEGDILPLISLNEDIRFMLQRNYTTAEKNAWPNGSYQATVTMTLEGR